MTHYTVRIARRIETHNTQLSGVDVLARKSQRDLRDRLLRPSGEATTSTACYVPASDWYVLSPFSLPRNQLEESSIGTSVPKYSS